MVMYEFIIKLYNTQKHFLALRKDEIIPFAATRIELKDMLSEMSQKDNCIYHANLLVNYNEKSIKTDNFQ